MKKTKIISTVLAVCLLAIVATGCSGNGSAPPVDDDSAPPASSNSTSNDSKIPPAAAGTVNEYGWNVPEETLEITFFHTDLYDPDKDKRTSAQMHEYLLENFNVDITRIIYDTDSTERLNLMLAGNDYPEVIVGMEGEMLSTWKAQDRLLDLAPYVEEFGPDMKIAMEGIYERYLDDDGALYGVPRGWGMFPIPDYSAGIRYDWYTEMGSPVIETPDDYFEVLSEMAALHPTNANGERVYAMSWNQTGQENFLDSLDAYLGIWGLKEGYKVGADNTMTHWLNTDEGLEAVTYLNKYTVAGLMDPDAFINTYEDWKQKFANERILGNINNWWQLWNAGHEVWQKTWDNWSDDQRFVQIALKAPEAEASYMNAKDTYGWNYVVVTDKCDDPAKVVKWMNFNMTDIGLKLLCWGYPNDENQSIWHYDGDGQWHWDETRKAELFDGTLNYDQYDLLGGWKYSFVESTNPMADGGCIWYDQNFNDEITWKKVIQENMGETIYDNTPASRITFTADNPLSVTKQQIDDAIGTGFAKCVMSATEEECVANFYDMRDALNKTGLQDIEAYCTEQYKIILEDWGL